MVLSPAMKPTRLVLAAALACAIGPVRVCGQGPGDRGWVGISYSLHVASTATASEVRVVVTDVMTGSPAAQVGIRAGDVLVRLNGRAITSDGFGRYSVRPGDAVRLQLRRGDRSHNVVLRAGHRPSALTRMTRLGRVLPIDSVADVIYHAMDSLRVMMLGSAEGRVTAVGLGAVVDSVMGVFSRFGPRDGARTPVFLERSVDPLPSGFPEARGAGSADVTPVLPEVRVPFGFFVFQGERHDSLQQEMERLNRALRDLRRREARRVAELARRFGTAAQRLHEDDRQLVRLRETLQEYSRRGTELRTAMERAAEEGATARVWTPGAVSLGGTLGRTIELRSRPLSPYILGQNRALGAHVVELRPELSEYFRVENGVLVVDVPGGTPANVAAIAPGDVITAVGTLPIRSLQNLRAALSVPDDELAISLVRKGRTLTVLLRR